ncbi:FimV/HubP family polar landmark protein [Psychromonas sp.]|uniref:FimV/HubP family polar landmark protein n=1 Tax=Psychromonas sp. TaxID=1884585 RepID=UPI003566C4E2
MKRLLLTLICCSSLLLSSAGSLAFDSTKVVSADIPAYQKYGPIRYYESLWSVSKKLRPNKTVSVQQTLVAIYKLNPKVFVDGDINHLIENSIINVPTYQLIKQQTNQEAIVLINKYSNLNKLQPAKTERVSEPIVKPHERAEQQNPAADDLPGLVTQRPDDGNVFLMENLNRSSDNGENYPVTAQLSNNSSLTEPIISLPGEALQADVENTALIAAATQVSSAANNGGNGALAYAAGNGQSDNQQPIKLQALQNELRRVNNQLLATIALNEDLKFGVRLLIDEIEILKSQIENESAAQENLLKLIEKYGIQLNSSQASFFDNSAVNKQTLSWVSASLANLLIVICLPLLVVILIFSLLLRRNNRKLLAGNNKFTALPGVVERESKELPLSDNSRSIHDHSQKTDKDRFTMSSNDKSDHIISNHAPRNKTTDELDYNDLTFLASEAGQNVPVTQIKQQAVSVTNDVTAQPRATEQCAENEKTDKADAVDALADNGSSDDDLSGHIPNAETADVAAEEVQSEAESIQPQADMVNISIKATPANAAIKLKNSAEYIAIETLLKNSEGDGPDELYTDLNVDLGLDDFPDMLSANTAIDIDDDEFGISAKLDLARAYLEIDDKASAKTMLKAAMENSNPEQRREIDRLLIRL